VPRNLRFEVAERIGADGAIVRPLDAASLDAAIAAVRAADVEAIAVCLINAFANPVHEQQIGARLRAELPGRFVSLSTEVLPQIREYERTSTTVVNAYVGPPVKHYLSAMIGQLGAAGVRGRLLVMQSSGGVLSAEAALDRPAQIVECGPAAGVIGARHLGRQLGYDNIITFDMGGTTAKASLIERGRLSTSEQYEVGSAMSATSPLMGGAGYALKLPVIDVSEVGAGGGSIVRVDSGGALKVGPESAGADPGPACYGRGGREPTVTDANVVLGYLNPRALAGGTVPIDADAARRAIAERIAAPLGRDLVETAWGIHLVANTNMMRAVKAVTTNRGRDTRDFVMLAFGGSGGVHAASLARELRIARIVVPPAAGVFSALGLLFADLELNESRACLRKLAVLSQDEVDRAYDDLAEGIAARLGRPRAEIAFQRLADLRYAGQAFEITVALPGGPFEEARAELARRFDAEHEVRYGHSFEGQYAHEVVNLRLVGSVTPAGARRIASLDPSASGAEERRQVYFGPAAGLLETPIIARSRLGETPRAGPLVIEEYEGTVVVPPDATAGRDADGNVLIDLATDTQ
jgi:N-methylhydantoinase A